MFHKSTELDSTRADGVLYEGVNLIFSNQPDLALPALKRAAKLTEDRKEIYYYLGLAFLNLGRYLEAIPNLRRVVDSAQEGDKVAEEVGFYICIFGCLYF
jgi:tetratricopeptide (TPR) repeat protein